MHFMIALLVVWGVMGCRRNSESTPKEGYLRGERLSERSLEALLRENGWGAEGDDVVRKAVCTALKESALWKDTIQHNRNSAGEITSTDFGLYQINDHYHLSRCDGLDGLADGKVDLLDPVLNVKCALLVFRAAERSFKWWHGYTANKTYCDGEYQIGSQEALLHDVLYGKALTVAEGVNKVFSEKEQQNASCENLAVGTQVSFMRLDTHYTDPVRKEGKSFVVEVSLPEGACRDSEGKVVTKGWMLKSVFAPF